mgnify:CR=1 FL=1
MFYNAKNHTVTIDGDTTDFISFGKGKKNLVIIPGVGDGLKTAKGLAIPFAIMYRLFAKDFTVYDIDGNPVKLSDFRGRPIVLNFWASDCYYCVQEMPDFQNAYEKYGDEVVFLMVCHVRFANRAPSYEKNFIDNPDLDIVFDSSLRSESDEP